MTAYVRRGGEKKREQLERARSAMSGAVSNGATRKELERLAEKLRAAQLGYLKSRLHELGPGAAESEGSRARRNEYSAAGQRWGSLTVDEIIATCAGRDESDEPDAS
jgi:hypothetical protein